MEMLKKESLDAVFILLPPHAHGEVEKACAAYVPAVLVEKPIANDLETAIEVQKAFEEAGTIVSAGYMMRYYASVNRARELFAASTDKPALVSGWWVNPMPPPLWWRTGAQSGGQFVEQCTHLVDAARYIAGDIVSVSAFSASGFVKDVPDYSTEDATTVTVQFTSGAVGNFTTGCFPRDFGAEIGLSIESRSLQCHFTGWGMELLADHGAGRTEHFNAGGNDIFVAQNAAFLKAVATRDTSGILSTYESGVKTLRVTLAAVESAKTGKVVRLGDF
jgi:predicted dehydrogenase